MIAQCPLPPAKMKALPILAKNSWKTEIQAPRCAPPHTKTTASPKYPASHCRPRIHNPLNNNNDNNDDNNNNNINKNAQKSLH